MSTTSSSPRPSSPAKPGAILTNVFKPNPHPYAIKTTSTGVLSRSSSSVSHSHNHYVPSSPSPSPTKAYFPEHSERGSRHRYSRSLTEENSPQPLPVPPEELNEPQRSGPRRSRADTLPATLDDSIGPKSWTPEQLSANVPEIAAFVQENEITGRAFLRFDDGVLDAYGITSHSQRSLILSHSRRLRQSMLYNRVWPKSNASSDPDAAHELRSLSREEEEDDPAYLSSSSSISSASSSISGRRKRRVRPNGRVQGMVSSYERSTSPDKAELRRERSGSISSVDDNDHQHFFTPQVTGEDRGRPLPSPPKPTGDYVPAPFLLPQQTSFPNSFPRTVNSSRDGNPFSAPQVAGNSNTNFKGADGSQDYVVGPPLLLPRTLATNDLLARESAHASTAPLLPPLLNHAISPPKTPASRPLPATPLPPSLRPPPVFADEDSDSDAEADEKKSAKNKSGEMTMDELIGLLNPDTDADADTNAADSGASDLHGFVNTDRRKNREKEVGKRISGNGKGGAAWEMDAGDTVKHIPPQPEPTKLASTSATAKAPALVDDEMTVEELLALEGEGNAGAGAAAWVDQPQDATVQTMKRIEEKMNTNLDAFRFGSVGRKSADRISLSAGRKLHGRGEEKKKSVRRVEQLFASTGDVGDERDEQTQRHGVPEMGAEEVELERMRKVERELLRAEEEERMRWEQQGAKEELRNQEETRLEEEREALRRREEHEEELRVRKVNEERLRELFQRQKRMEEEARRHLAQEAEAKDRQAREEADAEQRRNEDAERRLASSIQENRRLLEEFRTRLDEVEHRIEELEAAASASTPPQGEPAVDPTRTGCLERRLRRIAAWAFATPFGAVLPTALSMSFAEFAGEAHGGEDTATTVSRQSKSRAITLLLPRYALFFGIGLCAVVLRGLMRWGVMGVRGMGAVGARGVRGR